MLLILLLILPLVALTTYFSGRNLSRCGGRLPCSAGPRTRAAHARRLVCVLRVRSDDRASGGHGFRSLVRKSDSDDRRCCCARHRRRRRVVVEVGIVFMGGCGAGGLLDRAGADLTQKLLPQDAKPQLLKNNKKRGGGAPQKWVLLIHNNPEDGKSETRNMGHRDHSPQAGQRCLARATSRAIPKQARRSARAPWERKEKDANQKAREKKERRGILSWPRSEKRELQHAHGCAGAVLGASSPRGTPACMRRPQLTHLFRPNLVAHVERSASLDELSQDLLDVAVAPDRCDHRCVTQLTEWQSQMVQRNA